MKNLSSISLVLLTLLLCASPAAAQEATSAPPTSDVKCDRGPVPHTFGNGPWLVYGCSDEQSLVIVTAPQNPAGPFYFKFSPQQDGYHLTGEGTGQKDAVADAFKDLKSLTKQDIVNL